MRERGERDWMGTKGKVILIITLRYRWLRIATKNIKPLYLLFTLQNSRLRHAVYDVMWTLKIKTFMFMSEIIL